MYRYLVKPILFLIPPERAHYFTVFFFKTLLSIPLIGRFLKTVYRFEEKRLERNYLGLHFKNPIGLAAGFDKDGRFYNTMAALGFGFVEVGTVTPKPQAGNPIPRLFRLPQSEALINRMGFNNQGVDQLVSNLQQGRPEGLIIGGNIGKNKATPNEKAVDDYAHCFERLFPYVDYFVVNVSSPNTPNLRALQEKEPLTKLLRFLQDLNQAKPVSKPILLKIAPDLTNEQLDDILEIIQHTKIDGVIATNTTIDRSGLKEGSTSISSIGSGGFSGKPLEQRSTEVIRYLSSKTNGKLFIIGVGGIHSPDSALEKLKAGASLVQIYTGLIYEGPSLIKRINNKLAKTKDL